MYPDGDLHHLDHTRLGGRILSVCPESMRITGQAAQWEEWTGLSMPTAGTYVIPDGLVPVEVDQEGIGRYVEPNVWLVHDLHAHQT